MVAKTKKQTPLSVQLFFFGCVGQTIDGGRKSNSWLWLHNPSCVHALCTRRYLKPADRSFLKTPSAAHAVMGLKVWWKRKGRRGANPAADRKVPGYGWEQLVKFVWDTSAAPASGGLAVFLGVLAKLRDDSMACQKLCHGIKVPRGCWLAIQQRAAEALDAWASTDQASAEDLHHAFGV